MPLIEGQVLEGKYEIVRLLARGGMGDVYLGTNQRIGKPIAIKVLSTELAAEPAAVERFEQEARVAPRIRSAHVAETYDLGELPSGERFIVMELLEGETLGARLDKEERISERALAAIALQILDALASAHEAGVVHRDLKPDNVFLTKRDGRDFVKVVDFGVAKVRDAETNPRLTVAGALVGTPAYMSPEQARGKGVDHRTDLYALGIILFEATLGAPPFEAENLTDMLFRIALDTPAPLDELVASVTPELSAIVQKALAKAADDRYQTAAAMRDDVLAWQEACGPTPGARISSASIVPHVTDVATHTPHPWSIPSGDREEVDPTIPPPRRSLAGMAAMGILAGLVVLGVTRPQDLRAMSSGLASPTTASRPTQTRFVSAPPAALASPISVVTAAAPPPSAAPVVATPPSSTPLVAAASAPAAVAPRSTPPKSTAPKLEPKPEPKTPSVEPAPAPPPPPRDPEVHEDTIY